MICSSEKAVNTLLDIKKINISIKYFDFINVFLFDSTIKLLEYTNINNYPINLVDNIQLAHSLIYSLLLVKLETLKIIPKSNLASRFI